MRVGIVLAVIRLAFVDEFFRPGLVRQAALYTLPGIGERCGSRSRWRSWSTGCSLSSTCASSTLSATASTTTSTSSSCRSSWRRPGWWRSCRRSSRCGTTSRSCAIRTCRCASRSCSSRTAATTTPVLPQSREVRFAIRHFRGRSVHIHLSICQLWNTRRGIVWPLRQNGRCNRRNQRDRTKRMD